MKPLTELEMLNDPQGRPDVTVVDVRSPDENVAGHLPNAVSIAIDELGVRRTPRGPSGGDLLQHGSPRQLSG